MSPPVRLSERRSERLWRGLFAAWDNRDRAPRAGPPRPPRQGRAPSARALDPLTLRAGFRLDAPRYAFDATFTPKLRARLDSTRCASAAAEDAEQAAAAEAWVSARPSAIVAVSCGDDTSGS
jgi:hypothetical protein